MLSIIIDNLLESVALMSDDHRPSQFTPLSALHTYCYLPISCENSARAGTQMIGDETTYISRTKLFKGWFYLAFGGGRGILITVLSYTKWSHFRNGFCLSFQLTLFALN